MTLSHEWNLQNDYKTKLDWLRSGLVFRKLLSLDPIFFQNRWIYTQFNVGIQMGRSTFLANYNALNQGCIKLCFKTF